jgi:hypothetical protein
MPDLTTGEALAQARALVADARLNDPGEHFPYKRKVVDALVAKDAPLGPEGPKDASVSAQDFMTPRIAEATDAYIAAQAAYLADSSSANRERYDMARDDLVAARQSHRRTRVDAQGNPVLNVTATSASADQDHLRGTRFRRPGEE